eukprot:TRINITY_DN105931_c0_g1_i1.p1 TRINITY_DN105931_c0_g1~~TRINITY_DN105931_c0_g1_i1.p1  ORF type:complete len:411 (-),score=67.54 TRINITY_DN105931_c0_g1_i1:37-1248(-)
MVATDVTLCVALSCVGGLCTTLGVNVLQYKNHLEKSGRHVFTPIQSSVCVGLNITFSLASIVFFVLATGFGPVSIAMPVLSASCLLGNMAVQVSMGMQHFTKSMTVGTWVLVFAVLCLIDVGPKGQNFDDPLSLLMTPLGAASVLVQLALIVLGSIGVASMKSAPQSSMPKILSFALLVAASTSLGASIGKLMQMHLEFWPRTICIGGYLGCGVVSFAGAVLAADSCDGSVYLPVRSCIQLLLNAATGLCVWEDWRTIEYWTSYTSVYILIVLGVYEVSSYDLGTLFSDIGHHSIIPQTEFEKAAQKLTQVWQECPDEEEKLADAVSDVLHRGLKSKDINQKDLLELIMQLLKKHKELGPRETAATWMSDKVHHFRHYYDHTADGLLPRNRKNMYRAATVGIA